jgi:hypothetical protein
MLFRVLALSLAIGGAAWGLVVLVLLLLGGHALDFVLIFGPGYAITAAYAVRACHTPRQKWRLLLWIMSALVQGSWLVPSVLDVVRGGGAQTTFYFLSLGWWAYAFLVSVYGIVGDVDDVREKRQDV